LNPIGGGWKTSNLYSFQGGGNGYSPASVLVLDRRGTLYGTLSRGDNGGGVIFELQEEGDFGILKWSTWAVCFGPPWAQQTSTLDLSVSLDLEAGVGLESQGGAIRADSVGV
jgi:hypothetical protein